MNIKLGNSELCLRPGQPLGLRGAAGLGIRCIAGTVWITSPGEPTDIFLEAGGFHCIQGPGLTLVESLGEGRIGLTWPEHESEGKRWLAAPGRRLKDWAAMLGRKPAISRTARVASAAGSPA